MHMTDAAVGERPPVRASGTTAIDPWLAREFARVLDVGNPLYTDASEARAAGFRDALVPEGQLFLVCRVGDEGAPPRDALDVDGALERVGARLSAHLGGKQ